LLLGLSNLDSAIQLMFYDSFGKCVSLCIEDSKSVLEELHEDSHSPWGYEGIGKGPPAKRFGASRKERTSNRSEGVLVTIVVQPPKFVKLSVALPHHQSAP
jgi:hypothetical protein